MGEYIFILNKSNFIPLAPFSSLSLSIYHHWNELMFVSWFTIREWIIILISWAAFAETLSSENKVMSQRALTSNQTKLSSPLYGVSKGDFNNCRVACSHSAITILSSDSNIHNVHFSYFIISHKFINFISEIVLIP